MLIERLWWFGVKEVKVGVLVFYGQQKWLQETFLSTVLPLHSILPYTATIWDGIHQIIATAGYRREDNPACRTSHPPTLTAPSMRSSRSPSFPPAIPSVMDGEPSLEASSIPILHADGMFTLTALLRSSDRPTSLFDAKSSHATSRTSTLRFQGW